MSSAEIINYFTIILAVLSFFIFKFFNLRIANYFKLIDRPNKTKIHKVATPLTASFSIFFIYLISHLNYLLFDNINNDVILIFLSGAFGFAIGVLDDKKNLNYITKFLLFIVFIILITSISESLILDKLYFETFNKFIHLNKFESSLITLLCLLLLINATNLSDGINGLCLGILIIWLLFFM